jgi:hypothetical protein
MNQRIKDIVRAAGLGLAAVAMAGLTACTKEDNTTAQPTPQAVPVYQVSIPADFGDGAQTRAVSYNDVTGGLDATFKTTDDIFVYNKTKDVDAQDNNYNPKFLHPDANGATAKLTGQLTFYGYPEYVTVDKGDVLLLTNNAGGYVNYNADATSSGNQSGTLACLNLFDFASCEVSITGISGAGTVGDPYTLTTSKANFVNAQSMYKFTFTGLPWNVGVKKVTIHSARNKLVRSYGPTSDGNGYGDVWIDLSSNIDGYAYDGDRRNANGHGVVYAALRFQPLGASETDDITFTVTGTDGNTYIATKTSPVGGFQNSKYYTSTIALYPQIVDLNSVTADTTLQNGQTLTHTLDGTTQKYKISIAAGATVTLSNATINGVHTDDSHELWAGLTCEGDATIILDGTNAVENFNRFYPGLQPGPTGTTLTIRGDGSLTATGRNFGAGIGTKYDGGSCGNIRIEGGTVTANGNRGAGIGSNDGSTCGDITITGGNVTANGVNNGAGIGSGDGFSGNSQCGDITITGGTVIANGGGNGAGIGTGNGGKCGSISISGSASVTATGGGNGAGIGTGKGGKCGSISISGGTVMAQGGGNATGIGTGNGSSGHKAECGDISISKGKGFVSVTAIRGAGASMGIGTCNGYNNDSYKCGRITFDGDENEIFDGSDGHNYGIPGNGDYGNLRFAISTMDDGDNGTDDTNNTWTLTPIY